MLDNPMIAPELTFTEPASMDDAVSYDRDEKWAERFNMVDYTNKILREMGEMNNEGC